MTDSLDFSQQLQGQILEAVRKGQDTVVDVVKSAVKPFEDAVKPWTETVQKLAPQLPVDVPVPAVAGLADKLPKPGALVDDYYAFAEQLLAAQKEFAHKLLDVTAPLLDYPKK